MSAAGAPATKRAAPVPARSRGRHHRAPGGGIMGDLRPVEGIAETDNVKRRLAWLASHPGASITAAGDWWTARDAAGILLQRRQDLGDLMDALERRP